MPFIEIVLLTKIISRDIQWEDCHLWWAGGHGLFHTSFPYSRINLVGCDTMNFDRFQHFGGTPCLHHQDSSTLMMKAAHSFKMLSFQLIHPTIRNHYFMCIYS
jgi:hypothetical protein